MNVIGNENTLILLFSETHKSLGYVFQSDHYLVIIRASAILAPLGRTISGFKSTELRFSAFSAAKKDN